MDIREMATEALEQYEARLTFVDCYDSLLNRVESAIMIAVATEREECAKVADDDVSGMYPGVGGPQAIAQIIRARC